MYQSLLLKTKFAVIQPIFGEKSWCDSMVAKLLHYY